MLRQFSFWWRYLRGDVPWDTGTTPPELIHLIEDEQLAPGRAIDLGCGTGTNAIFLARHGWEVVGIDYIAQPIRTARRKARGLSVGARARFSVGDVTQLADMELGGPFDLAVDIGCGHALSSDARRSYAENLGRILRPGGIVMLYMLRPTPQRAIGLEPPAVRELFSRHFDLIWYSLGSDEAAHAGSCWYRLRRVELS